MQEAERKTGRKQSMAAQVHSEKERKKPERVSPEPGRNPDHKGRGKK